MISRVRCLIFLRLRRTAGRWITYEASIDDIVLFMATLLLSLSIWVEALCDIFQTGYICCFIIFLRSEMAFPHFRHNSHFVRNFRWRLLLRSESLLFSIWRLLAWKMYPVFCFTNLFSHI